MSLPGFVKAFWYASIDLGERSARTPWGAVATDSRYPLIWDANNATVLEGTEKLTTLEIRSALHPALRDAAAPYEHVEFWETTPATPALQELRRSGQRPDPDVVMVFEAGAPPEVSNDLRIEEVEEPDPSFWAWYRESLKEFGSEQSDDVLDQLVARVKDVFLPAGLRWFVGHVDGEPAGYTSLISLEGVGYLDQVVTMPPFRRRGVASATVAAAISASMRGADRHRFLLAEKNGDPQRLYERLGFRAVSPIESFTSLLPPA